MGRRVGCPSSVPVCIELLCYRSGTRRSNSLRVGRLMYRTRDGGVIITAFLLARTGYCSKPETPDNCYQYISCPKRVLVMKLKNISCLIGVAMLAVYGQSANANSTISASYLGSAYGYGTGTINPGPNGGSTSVSIGAFKMQNTTPNTYDFAGPSSTQNLADEFVAWCVDPLHWLKSSYTYNVGGTTEMIGFFGQTRVNDLQSLANQHYAEINTTIESAAFQVATWTILYGNDSNGNGAYDFDLSGSAFKATNLTPGDPDGAGPGLSVKDLALSYLNNLGTAQSTGNFKINYLFDNSYINGCTQSPCTQDLVTFTPSPVPLPAAAWLFGSALFGFITLSNRRKI